jgi:hypothetical protein
MHQNKWFKIIALGTLLWSMAFAGGMGIAAAAATGPERNATFVGCAQPVKEELGTVLPSMWPSSLLAQCPGFEARRAKPNSVTDVARTYDDWRDARVSYSAGVGIIPVSGAARTYDDWRDAGTGVTVETLPGWLDAGASR